MPRKISGRMIAKTIKERLKAETSAMLRKPGLAAVLVGNDHASHLYVELKEKTCAEFGIRFEKHVLSEKTTTHKLKTLIHALNAKRDVDGILIQLPLPRHLDEDEMIGAIDPRKDADGFHPANLKLLLEGKEPFARPVMLNAVEILLDSPEKNLRGKKAVVVGNSDLFCNTIKRLEQERGLSVRGLSAKQLTGRDKQKASSITQKADVLIVAVGKPKLIEASMVKNGVIIIDIGTTRTDGGVEGDASSGARNKSSWFTPVPGGVGPVTVACLLENVVTLAQHK